MKRLFVFALSLMLIACQSNKDNLKKPNAPDDGVAPLASSMQSLKENLNKLLPLVIDRKSFNAAENSDRINRDVAALLDLSKQVNHNPQIQSMDPSLRFISRNFTDELSRAKESLNSGQRDFARYTLMNLTAYCIECHTRTSSGPAFNTSSIEQNLKSMTNMEQGEYLLATRQFDRAFVIFKEAIKDSLKKGGNLFELDRAVRNALSISVKFQRDSEKSLQIAKILVEGENTPFYLRQSAKSWELAIRQWQKERNPKLESGPELLARSRQLVGEGRHLQSGLSDRGGEIYFLRALSYLHELLSKSLKSDQLGEALYLTGSSYEAVRDLSLWSLHEDYYESCIRQVPHSAWSEKCFNKLEESIYFGYTGSSGVSLPMDMQVKLDDLKKIALPEVPSKPAPNKN